MNRNRASVLAILLLLFACAVGVFAQPKPTPKPTPRKPPTAHTVSSAPRQIVFAVVNSGSTLEPIGYVSKGKFSEVVNGSGEATDLKKFSSTYYKKGTGYTLVFGGAKAGTASVTSSNVNTECGKNTANAKVSGSAHLSKLVMGLGTNRTEAR